MKKKVVIHEFDPVIYPRKLWVVVTKDMSIITNNFLDKNSKGEMVYSGDIGNDFHAITQKVTHKESRLHGSIIVFGNKTALTSKNIAHESTHAARQIWNELGEDVTGEEADAYLVGWIAECCEKVKLNKE